MDRASLHAILEDPLLVGGAGAALCAVTAIGFSLRHLLSDDADRIEARIDRAEGTFVGPGASGGPARSLTREAELDSPWRRLLRLLARLARPREGAELSRTQARLEQAGLRGAHVIESYFGAKILLSVVLAGGFLALAAMATRPVPNAFRVAVVLAAIGFYAPNAWLGGRIAERQKLLRRALPDALDLLVACVEAGLAVEAALARVVKEIGLSAALLAAELSQATLEMRAGITRGEAFRRLAARTGLEELRLLSAMLVQTELFGTSIGKALRIQAGSMRVKRSQRAEERAAKVATKMMVPLILCILPTLLIVIIGPAVVRIHRTLLPSLGGH